MKTILAFVTIAFFQYASASVPVNSCDDTTPIPISFESEGCIKPPCPFVKGTTAKGNITFKIPDDTDIVTIDIKAKTFGIWVPFSPPDNNVCHSLLNSYCPLDQNEVVTYQMAIPVQKYYPDISLLLKIKMLDEKKKEIMCMTVDCKVVKPKSSHRHL